MSFFGFDTSLPRDRKDDKPLSSAFGGGGGGGGALDDEELDAKIRGLTAGAQEDVQVRKDAAQCLLGRICSHGHAIARADLRVGR